MDIAAIYSNTSFQPIEVSPPSSRKDYTKATISPLHQRMIEDMKARRLISGTQKGHIRGCRRFAAFLRREARELKEVVAALVDLHSES